MPARVALAPGSGGGVLRELDPTLSSAGVIGAQRALARMVELL